ncbi:SUMO-activating enzyme subunit 2 [Bagarius yarrelli]|uniref:SUMO-activating enzyme subunit 2 n=1 Tax=Bagarius yarrelli TaxID=175774 RepID=A0A556VUT9_BAGYA|nr:SUMO-activating enzyme subunit 2 [Bagarius yarrelli]
MEVKLDGPLRKELADSVSSCRVLVVGAGGIGCELLKNLVLTGFKNIEVIDLDTIDVSNLNRQFLFQKKHVGKSKAQVAKESVLRFCPSANITAYHDSIMNPDYNVEFFRSFQLVMNALDNRAARNHVNRMCLAADIPLIESGTAGYLGQVTVIKKGATECYECQPKPTQKTFPGCTIRNPEETAARAQASDQDGDIKRVSTKEWARSTGYDPVKLFNKLFKDDIMYLLTMDKLWKKRKAPEPLDWCDVQQLVSSQDEVCGTGLKDQQVLSVSGYCKLFQHSVNTLRSQLAEKGDGAELVWDKVTMAGNIIPAIATTNAVIAGLIVLEALKILSSDFQQCRTPNPRKKLLVPCTLDRPNPNCYVCASKPEVTVKLNVHKVIVQTLQDRILKERFGMVAPDVQIEDGKGTILISSEEGETEANNCKLLSDFGIRNGSRLQADDFHQDYTLLVNVVHCEEMPKDVEFEVVGEAPEKAPPTSTPEPEKSITNGNKDSAQPSTSAKVAAEEDDVLIVDSDEEPSSSTMDVSTETNNLKRKLPDSETNEAAPKRKRLDQQPAENDEDDIIALD